MLWPLQRWLIGFWNFLWTPAVCFFPLRMGSNFPRETLSGLRLSFSLGRGDGIVTGSESGAACPSPSPSLPTPFLEPGNGVESSMLRASPAPALPSAGWAGARSFQGAGACLSAPGALWRRLGAPGSLRGPPFWTGFCSTPPALEHGGGQLHLARRGWVGFLRALSGGVVHM